MIELLELTKRYGATVAVDGISATVRPGVVTGFLGPNGAGKSTTMRAVVGLDRPTSGLALVNGRPYEQVPAPLGEVGALLDAKGLDKRRSARNHLLALGASVGIGPRRVDEVLDLVGLTEVAHKGAGMFSLGMGQRLGLAAALLGDPGVLVLDEPVNGLDLDGIQWIRALLKDLADEGRTVLLSSHLMSEMELVAQHLLVIGQGRILADSSMADFIAAASPGIVRVTTPDAAALAAVLTGPGARIGARADEVVVTVEGTGHLQARGLSAERIGDLAFDHGLRVHGLVEVSTSLEDAYLELTRDTVEFTGHVPPHAPATTPLTSRSAA